MSNYDILKWLEDIEKENAFKAPEQMIELKFSISSLRKIVDALRKVKLRKSK